MKKIIALFVAVLLSVPSLVSARIPRDDLRYNNHHEHQDRRWNQNQNHDHHRGGRGNDIIADLFTDIAVGTGLLIVNGVAIGVASAIERSVQDGHCYRDVTPGYPDGYGRFILTGPTQRTQVPCR